MHFIKFKRTLEGLRKYGILYNENNMISGHFLIKNNNKKFIVNSGIHRTIIIKYLNSIDSNFKNIICKKNKKDSNGEMRKDNGNININKIKKWYHVKKKKNFKRNCRKNI